MNDEQTSGKRVDQTTTPPGRNVNIVNATNTEDHATEPGAQPEGSPTASREDITGEKPAQPEEGDSLPVQGE